MNLDWGDGQEPLGAVPQLRAPSSQHCGVPLVCSSRALDVTMPGFKSSATVAGEGQEEKKMKLGE